MRSLIFKLLVTIGSVLVLFSNLAAQETNLASPPHQSMTRADRDSLVEFAVRQREQLEILEAKSSPEFLKLQNCDVTELEPFIAKLALARDSTGYRDLPAHGMRIANLAGECAEKGESGAAASLIEAAMRLAPNTHSITGALGGLLIQSGYGSRFGIANTYLMQLLNDVRLQFWLLMTFAYPTLIGFSISIYIVMILLLARSLGQRGFSDRRLLSVVSVSLVAVAFLGLLWALLFLSVILLWVMRRKGERALGFDTVVKFTGAILILWGAAIPLREQIAFWFMESGPYDSGPWKIERAAGGQFYPDQPSTIDRCNQLSERRPDDLRAHLWCAQLLRYEGKYSASTAILSRIEPLIRFTRKTMLPELLNAKALVAFGQRDFNSAQQNLDEASSLARNDWRLQWNQSVLAFQKADLAKSSSFLMEATKRDSKGVETLQTLESFLGVGHPVAMANHPPTFTTVWQSIAIPQADASLRADQIGRAIMFFATPPAMSGLGVAIFVAGLISGSIRRRDSKSRALGATEPIEPLPVLKFLVPGYKWLCADRPLFAILSFAILVGFVMLFIGWPPEIVSIQSVLPSWTTTTPVLIVVVYLILSALAYCTVDESLAARFATQRNDGQSLAKTLAWGFLVAGIAIPALFWKIMPIWRGLEIFQ